MGLGQTAMARHAHSLLTAVSVSDCSVPARRVQLRPVAIRPLINGFFPHLHGGTANNISPVRNRYSRVPKSNNATPSGFFSTIEAIDFQIVGVSWILDTGMQSSLWGDP